MTFSRFLPCIVQLYKIWIQDVCCLHISFFFFISGFAIFTFGYFALTRMVTASARLHNRMLESILRSPMSFFDTTPIGRIMNRFSSDIDIMDDRLPMTFRLWTIQIFSMIATIVVVCISTPYFIAVLGPIMAVYIFLLVSNIFIIKMRRNI